MMTNYTMAFRVLGVAGGLLLTPNRRWLKSPWLWCGVVIASLMMLPNIVWQMQHQVVSLECMKTIHTRDLARGSTNYFLVNQFCKSTQIVAVPVWCAGLWYLFATPQDKRYRMLGWMYLVPRLAFLVVRGRDYYLAPAYPMLLAAAAVWGEKWVHSLSSRSASWVRQTTWQTMAWAGVETAAMTIPIAPLNSSWWRTADQLNGNFNMQIGWPDAVETIGFATHCLSRTRHSGHSGRR